MMLSFETHGHILDNSLLYSLQIVLQFKVSSSAFQLLFQPRFAPEHDRKPSFSDSSIYATWHRVSSLEKYTVALEIPSLLVSSM